jgi:Holliday junction resolvasome RuvABC endonuclease subunit
VTSVLGLDQSLTSFAAARVSSDRPVELHRWRPGARRGHDRLQWLLDHLEAAAEGCDFGVIEGLSFGAKGSSLLDLAGLFGVVTHRLWQIGLPYAVVPPSSRMKYLTGKGQADKDTCLLAVVKRFPGIEVDGNDQADALTMGAMGADWGGFPLVQMPETHRAALTVKNSKGKPAIAWPERTWEVSRAVTS